MAFDRNKPIPPNTPVRTRKVDWEHRRKQGDEVSDWTPAAERNRHFDVVAMATWPI